MALLSGPSLSLVSVTGGSGLPFTLGHAFKQGDIPAGSTVQSSSVTGFQCAIKNAWPDGSVKFAVLSGLATLTANTPLSVALDTTAASALTGLTTAALKATGITADITTDTFGSASWANTDWDSPFQTIVSGPTMTSWTYRKQIGSDAHLVGWLEVRLYSNGSVDVLPWVENGYINVASPTNKNATYTFTLGGTQRYTGTINLRNHQRTPLIDGATTTYWFGTASDIRPIQSRAYYQASELVPTYSVAAPDNAWIITKQTATYVPLQIGGFVYDNDSMASTGYQPPIGLLPEHDVAWIVSSNTKAADMYDVVQRNGFSAGRYPVHYRDENTNRPLRFSQWPNMVIGDSQGFKDNGSSTTSSYTPVPSGGNAPQWDVAHCPSVGYLAYLLTGRQYFMEEVQFAATTNYLGNGNNSILRNGSQNLVRPCIGAWQTRSTAWSWRSLTQALCVTPDNDTNLRTEFITSVQYNLDHFHNRYIVQTNNPFGMIEPGEDYGIGTHAVAAWQQDFVTAAFGYSLAMGLPLNATYQTKHSEFFQWKAKSVAGRLSDYGSGYFFGNAAVYLMSVSTNVGGGANYATGAGPWRPDWTSVWNAESATLGSFGSPNAWMTGNSPNTMYGEIMPGERSQWGNLMAALAYAVRFNATGAKAGLDRIKGATNYAALETNFATYPVWSVAPAYTTAAVTSYTGSTLRIRKPADFAAGVHVGSLGFGVLGATIRSETATGSAGAGALYEMLGDSSDDNKEISLRVTQWPASGKLFVFNNGSYKHTGAADGSWPWKAVLTVQGKDVGSEFTVTDVFGGAEVSGPFAGALTRGNTVPGGTFTAVQAGVFSASSLTRAVTSITGAFTAVEAGSFAGSITRATTALTGTFTAVEAGSFSGTLTRTGTTVGGTAFNSEAPGEFAGALTRTATDVSGTFTAVQPSLFTLTHTRGATVPGGVFEAIVPEPFSMNITRGNVVAAGTFSALAPAPFSGALTRQGTSVAGAFTAVVPDPSTLPVMVRSTLSERNNLLALINRASRGAVYTWDDIRVISVQEHERGEGEEFLNDTSITTEGINAYEGTFELLYRRLDLNASLSDNLLIPRRVVYDSATETAEAFRQRIAAMFGLCYSPADPQRGVVIPFVNSPPNQEVTLTITPHRGADNWIFTGSLQITVIVVNGMTASSNLT
jgi:hypothetical protein